MLSDTSVEISDESDKLNLSKVKWKRICSVRPFPVGKIAIKTV